MKRSPTWSPDDQMLVFDSPGDRANGVKGPQDLFRKPSNGARPEELLHSDDTLKTPMSWSPDGKYLVYQAAARANGTVDDLWILPGPRGLAGLRKPTPFMPTPFREAYGQFSPNGQWIAYQSNESRQFEIYVAPFPGPGAKRLVSRAGGVTPRWRSDGKEIFYVAPDRRLMAAEVTATGSAFEVGAIQALFTLPPTTGYGVDYDVAKNGQQFLVLTPSAQAAPEPLTLVKNWTARLKKN